MNLPEKLVRDKATVPLEQKDGRVHGWRALNTGLVDCGEERPASQFLLHPLPPCNHHPCTATGRWVEEACAKTHMGWGAVMYDSHHLGVLRVAQDEHVVVWAHVSSTDSQPDPQYKRRQRHHGDKVH